MSAFHWRNWRSIPMLSKVCSLVKQWVASDAQPVADGIEPSELGKPVENFPNLAGERRVRRIWTLSWSDAISRHSMASKMALDGEMASRRSSVFGIYQTTPSRQLASKGVDQVRPTWDEGFPKSSILSHWQCSLACSFATLDVCPALSILVVSLRRYLRVAATRGRRAWDTRILSPSAHKLYILY